MELERRGEPQELRCLHVEVEEQPRAALCEAVGQVLPVPLHAQQRVQGDLHGWWMVDGAPGGGGPGSRSGLARAAAGCGGGEAIRQASSLWWRPGGGSMTMMPD